MVIAKSHEENTHPVNFNAETEFVGRKDDFLSRSCNNKVLSFFEELEKKGCTIINASGDADVDIVKAAVTQIMVWNGKDGDMNTVDWGWKLVYSRFWPVMTSNNAAPESLLQMIHCNCTTA